MKDVQATGEAFSPQKRTSSTSKHEISLLALLDPDPADQNQCGSGSTTQHLLSLEWPESSCHILISPAANDLIFRGPEARNGGCRESNAEAV
jgi:hypothetical protein